MWKSACCAVQGIGHKKKQIPCQDKTFLLEKNGVHVIALADGAGSAKLSHYGAENVVQNISLYMTEHFQECFNCDDAFQIKQEIIRFIKNGLINESEIHACDIKDLASTLLVVAIYEDNFILAHVGDGVIGYLDGDSLKVASIPDNGEFSNVTTFVTSSSAVQSMRLFKGQLKNKDGFVLMSDGTEQSLYMKKDKSLAKIIQKLMHRTCLLTKEVMEQQLEKAFSSVIVKKTQDDCSIAIIARHSKTLCTVDQLNFIDQCELYNITSFNNTVHKRIKRYNNIVNSLTNKCNIKQISKIIHLKPKYTQKHLDKLQSLGLIIKENDLYQKA